MEEESVTTSDGKVIKRHYTVEDLRAGRIRDVDLYGAIIGLGKDNVYEAQLDIERFLHSEDANLRSAALHVLGLYWQREEYRQTTLDLTLHDPDVSVRRLAASIIGIYFRNTQNSDILRVLAPVVHDTEENNSVRISIYAAMRSVFAYDPQEYMHIKLRLNNPFDIKKEVDWAFVETYLPE